MILLDVTLRDGGHCCDFEFSDHLMGTLLKKLDSSSVDYVEVGYRNGFLNGNKMLGKAAFCPNDFLLWCRNKLRKSKLAVMAHPTKINESDLEQLKLAKVDLLRLCFSNTGLHAATIKLIKFCNQLNLPISINITHGSKYSLIKLKEIMSDFALAGADCLYLADSNGSCLPCYIGDIFSSVSENVTTPLGFHGHDNLGLAQTNTLTALGNGASMIDASLLGLGKGGGNLQIERFVAYLQKVGNQQYDLAAVIEGAEILAKTFRQREFTLRDGRRGIDDLSSFEYEKRYPSLTRCH